MTVALALLAVAVALAMLLALPIREVAISPMSWLRAKELFFSKLTEEERRIWNAERRLTIRGSSGRRYTMMPYEAFNIRAGNDAFCLRVTGRLPAYDKLLAQRLLIECDEKRFLATANWRELRV